MRIGVLTSSRADYGIYLPLLKKLQNDDYFDLSIIAFGTHISPFHGRTIDKIVSDGFKVHYTLETMLLGDSANAVSSSMALTTLKFAEFWKNNKNCFDIVFCLGDRFEMFAAVTAGIPFEIKFAHLHGGERTLGAIDNIFRHSITLASSLHFVATEDYKNRVEELIENKQNVEHVGALSLDNLDNLELLSIFEFNKKFKIDLSIPTILCTFHPETVGAEKNHNYAEVISCTFIELVRKYQIVITLPNADTHGTKIRERFLKLPKETDNRVICVENFGTEGYFSCMKHCSFLLGNTSSGIIEAASFQKHVINIGDRQKGRISGSNVFNVKIQKEAIIDSVENIELIEEFTCSNPYYNGGAVDKIIGKLKHY